MFVAAWALIAIIAVPQGLFRSAEAIFAFSAVCVAQALLLGWIVAERHRYTLSAPTIFLAASVLFLVVMPAVAAAVRYHFVMQPAQHAGTTRLIALNFWLITAYVIVYLAVVGKTQLGPASAPAAPTARDVQVFSMFLIFAGFVGLVAFGTVLTRVLGLASLSYNEISEMLRGENWRIRIAELLPASGVVAYLLGTVTGWRMKAAGLASITLFAVLRAPFQNRENVIKFFVVLVIALQMQARGKANRWVTLALTAAALAVLFAFPFLSALRGGVEGRHLMTDYTYFVFRDLNFAEIAGAVMAEERFDSAIGWERGFLATFGSLVPRRLWSEKPHTVGVQVTEWVTPVEGYDVTAPLFAYAPTYVGFAYVVGGMVLALLIAAATAALVGAAVRWLAHQRSRTWPIDNALAALMVYYGAFAIVKLDPASVLTAMVLPAGFLVALRVVVRFRSWPARPGTVELRPAVESHGSPDALADQ